VCNYHYRLYGTTNLGSLFIRVVAAKSEEAHIPDQWTIEDHENLDGEGVTAQINGKEEVYVGNMHLFDCLGLLSLVPNKEVNMAKEWMQN
jgi:hypothetical protein